MLQIPDTISNVAKAILLIFFKSSQTSYFTIFGHHYNISILYEKDYFILSINFIHYSFCK